MIAGRLVRDVAVVAVLVSGLGACSADDEQGKGRADSSPIASTSPEPGEATNVEPSEPPGTEPSEEDALVEDDAGSTIEATLDWRDPDGYTLTTRFALEAEPFTADPTNAKPGWTDVQGGISGTVTLTNTTPSREIGGTVLSSSLYRGYANDSVVCQSLPSWPGVAGNAILEGPDHCYLKVGDLTASTARSAETMSPLASGQSRQVAIDDYLFVNSPTVFQVPEDDVLIAALAAPDFTAIWSGYWTPTGYREGALQTSDCRYCDNPLAQINTQTAE